MLHLPDRTLHFFLSILVLLALPALLTTVAGGKQIKMAPNQRQVQAAYARLPLSFEANQDLTDGQVQFLSRGSGYTLWLTGTEAVLGLRSRKPAPQASRSPTRRLAHSTGVKAPSATVRMKLLGSNPKPKVEGGEPLPGRTNYFIGNDPKKWRTNVRSYSRVKYEAVYPGVDLVYYGNQNQLEYDFIVRPGADPDQIRLAYSGAEQVKVDGEGDLVLHTAGGDVRQPKPDIYQEVDGERVPIAGEYVLWAEGSGSAAPRPLTHEVGFKLAAYDRSRPLIIDPVLSYGTLLGVFPVGGRNGIAVDGDGNVYVTGDAFTDSGNPLGDTVNAFVVKLDLSQSGSSALLYATYLGGNKDDYGNGIAVDASGNAYVTGTTYSPDFPTTAGKVMDDPGDEDADVFVAKLDPTGSGAGTLPYSTYLGGNKEDIGTGIAVDGAGKVYVAGTTYSPDFPTTVGKVMGDPGDEDADTFVAKLDPTKSGATALLFSTYLGGSTSDLGTGVAVDGAGKVYVTGTTYSPDFPTTAGKVMDDPGDNTSDAFVVKLDPTLSGAASLLYATYLGGNDDDEGSGVAVDGAGKVYVTGTTYSLDFPTTVGKVMGDPGDEDADVFVAKLDPTGSGAGALPYSTYLGGNGSDRGSGIAVDGTYVYVTGTTDSTNFPTTLVSQPQRAALDSFVVKLDPTKSGSNALRYATYLGGTNKDYANAIAVDGEGNAYVTGDTFSTDFPTTFDRLPTSFVSGTFVVVLSPLQPATPTGLNAATASETEIDLAWSRKGRNAVRFEVYHKPYGGSYSLAGTVPASTTSLQDKNLTPGATYLYFVRAVSVEEGIADSSRVSKATLPLPARPSNLQAVLFPGARARLSWEETDPNAKEFHLERKMESTAYIEIALLGSGVRQYYDESVAPNTHYTYQVRAFGTAAYSDYSNAAETGTPAPPSAPTGLSAQPVFSTQARLTWTAGSGDAPYQYRIERQSGGGSFQEVGQARGNAAIFLDGGLTAGTPYTYRVRAAVFGAFSDYSNTADVTTPAAVQAPTALSADPVSATQVKLTWTSGGGTVTYFRVERLVGGGWVEVGRGRPAESSYLEGGLAPETLCQYQVRAVSGGAVSAPSPEADATTRAASGAPATLSVKALSRGRMQLVWTPGAGTATAFQVERQEGASWVEAGKARPDMSAFIDTGRTAGTLYTYRVRAISGTTRSAPSPEAADTALP
jgi:hypothetical protein